MEKQTQTTNISEEAESEQPKYPLPDLFSRADEVMRGEEVKVTVKDLTFKPIKRCLVNRLIPDQKLLILKMGQKVRKLSTYYPIVVDDSIYTCVTKDIKRKLALFVFVGPYSKLNEIIQNSGAPITIEQ